MGERPDAAGPVGERSTGVGPGRVLVSVYGVFALSASARAGYQLATRLHEAPLAYLLSAFAGLVYIVATVALARGYRTLAWTAVLIELTGVLVIGTASMLVPRDFPKATVWSGFGIGYGWVPLALPIFGLMWLRRTSRGNSIAD